MRNFVFNELSNKKDSSFVKLFRKIDKIIQNGETELNRNTVTKIYIDVARQIT